MTATSVNDVSVHANDFDESVAYYKQLFGMERIPSPKAVYRRSHEQQLHDTTAFFSKMHKLADGSVQTYCATPPTTSLKSTGPTRARWTRASAPERFAEQGHRTDADALRHTDLVGGGGARKEQQECIH
jgi:hypothetical protein